MQQPVSEISNLGRCPGIKPIVQCKERKNNINFRVLIRPGNSSHLHCLARNLSQYEQSAAPPAIVPNRYGFISITFFTVCEAENKKWNRFTNLCGA